MNIKTSIAFIVLFAGINTTVLADCAKPDSPVIPDGAVADEDTMIDAQHAVKDYITQADQFLDCIVNENRAALESGLDTPEAKQARSDGYDEVYKDREAVPQAFNAELKKFRARPEPQ